MTEAWRKAYPGKVPWTLAVSTSHKHQTGNWGMGPKLTQAGVGAHEQVADEGARVGLAGQAGEEALGVAPPPKQGLYGGHHGGDPLRQCLAPAAALLGLLCRGVLGFRVGGAD